MPPLSYSRRHGCPPHREKMDFSSVLDPGHGVSAGFLLWMYGGKLHEEGKMPLRVKFMIVVLAVVGAWQWAACSDSGESELPAGPSQTSVLRAESYLTPGCYDWPTDDVRQPDMVAYALPFAPGDAVIDFTLREVSGVKHSLRDLLATRPVLLVFGAYT